MNYRTEIDGLRALAVIAVILFHAGVPVAQGGYFGVDIFFVISGYLITNIILADINKGSFSLPRFYERRALRILPALFFILLITAIFSEILLLPEDKPLFYQSLISVPLFVSNIFFYQDAGYWGIENELKPLLHTWSLAIEEQYYVLIPLCILALSRINKSSILIFFVSVFCVSLLFAEIASTKAPNFNFFMLTSRAWEIAAGSIVSILLARQLSLPGLWSTKPFVDSMSLAAFFMILVPIISFNSYLPHPGLYTLWPVMGTCILLCVCTSETTLGRLLSSKPVRSIGIISFSLYLWHQPVIALYRYRTGNHLNSVELLSLGTLIFLLSLLSWRFIEHPCRYQRVFTRKQVALTAIMISVVLMLWGFGGYLLTKESHSSLTNNVLPDNLQKANFGLSYKCDNEFTLTTECRTNDKPEIVIWGDSYAMHLVEGVIASKPDVALIQMTMSGCAPLIGLAQVDLPRKSVDWSKNCIDFNNAVINWLSTQNEPRYVVMSSSFMNYINSDRKLLDSHDQSIAGDLITLKTHLLKTIKRIIEMGHRPVLVSPTPSTGEDIANCLKQHSRLALDACNFRPDQMSELRQQLYQLLDEIKHEVYIVRLDNLMCSEGVCKTHRNGTFYYLDDGHLSISGSRALGERLNFYNVITRKQD